VAEPEHTGRRLALLRERQFRLSGRPEHFRGGRRAKLAAPAILALPNPAVPVLAIGVAATVLRRLPPRLDVRTFVLLFTFTTSVGAFARAWSLPAQRLAANGAWATAGIAAISSVVLNNLPAAVLFSAQRPLHSHALLLGLDLGPNLAVTGSLSAVLWLQAARRVEATVSIAAYTRFGLVLVPLTLAGTLAARGL
jgi:arsenical pump membrane protein